MRTYPLGHLLVADQRRLMRCRPGAQQPEVDTRLVHRRDGRVDRRLLLGDLLTGPPPRRLEHLMADEAQRRVLHPDVDDHPVEPARGRFLALPAPLLPSLARLRVGTILPCSSSSRARAASSATRRA